MDAKTSSYCFYHFFSLPVEEEHPVGIEWAFIFVFGSESIETKQINTQPVKMLPSAVSVVESDARLQKIWHESMGEG